jgi:hypothetical protein
VSSVTGRYLYKAKFTLNNLLFGNFPNVTKLNLDKSFMPFGEIHHQDYIEATKLGSNANPSEFHQWLLDEYSSLLKNEVIRRNRLEEAYRKALSLTWKRTPAFVAGQSDEI